MPSAARQRFDAQLMKSDLLRIHAGKLRRKSEATAKVVFLHASLAAQVAAWDSYVKAVAKEYFAVSARPADARFTAVHSLLHDRMLAAEKKLNTPNSEKSREFFMIFTGFYPWPHWSGITFGNTPLSSSLLVREKVDEIFKLRHSFAHGFSMPAFSWNQNSAGSAHLDCHIISNTCNFLRGLCRKTDSGLSQHIAIQFSITQPW